MSRTYKVGERIMTTKFEEKIYTLTQDAYLDSCNVKGWNYENCYFSSVVDEKGNDFMAVWEIENYDPTEADESNFKVDWDNATLVY